MAAATQGHPGHKNIIWVGKGFKGIDFSSPALTSSDAGVISGAVQRVVNMLRDSRVTLYTIDPTILNSTVASTTDEYSAVSQIGQMDAVRPDPFEGDVNFTALAKMTGGRSFYSRNDVDSEIGESVSDGENYYTISYRPTDASDAAKAYRHIHVSFSEPGLRGYYRDGYFADGTTAANQASPSSPRAAYDIQAAEAGTMVYTGLKVRAAAKPGAGNIYIVGVPENELGWTTEGLEQMSPLMVIGSALDNKGRVLRHTIMKVTARRKLDQQGSTGASLARVEIEVPLMPSTYRLRFLVRCEASGTLGTADILIPGAPPAKNMR